LVGIEENPGPPAPVPIRNVPVLDFDDIVRDTVGWPPGYWWLRPDAEEVGLNLTAGAIASLANYPGPLAVLGHVSPRALAELPEEWSIAIVETPAHVLRRNLAVRCSRYQPGLAHLDGQLRNQRLVVERHASWAVDLSSSIASVYVAGRKTFVWAASGAGKTTYVRARAQRIQRRSCHIRTALLVLILWLLWLMSGALAMADPCAGGISQLINSHHDRLRVIASNTTFPAPFERDWTPEYQSSLIDEPPRRQPRRRRNKVTQAALPVLTALANVVQKAIHPVEQIERVQDFLRTMPRRVQTKHAAAASAFKRPRANRTRTAPAGWRNAKPVQGSKDSAKDYNTMLQKERRAVAERKYNATKRRAPPPARTRVAPRPTPVAPVARRVRAPRSRDQPVARARQQMVAGVRIAKSSDRACTIIGQDRVAIVSNRDNLIGQSLVQFVVNPQVLGGERVRRIASTFDIFHFDSLEAHFSQAEGTAVPGEMLGWFEMDPVDAAPENDFGLKNGFAHSDSARTCSNYEPQTWVMPRAGAGRYYMENNGTTPSDQRLTQEAVFNLRTSVPTTLDPGSLVGTLWIRFQITMSKPTIQSVFVGSDDVYTRDNLTLQTMDSAFTEAIDATPGNNQSVLAPVSNAGTTNVIVNGIYAVTVPPGVWDFDITAAASDWSYAVTTVAPFVTSYSWFVTADAGLTSTSLEVGNGTSVASNVFTATAASTGTYIFTQPLRWGTRVVVPNDGLVRSYWITKANIDPGAAGSINILAGAASFAVSFSRVWPTESEDVELETTAVNMATLSRRLMLLEHKAEPSETKRSSKRRLLPPPPKLQRPLGAAAAPARKDSESDGDDSPPVLVSDARRPAGVTGRSSLATPASVAPRS
jgi:hypothetical protein